MINTFLYPHSFITCKEVSVLPKRIFAFHNISLSFLKTLTVWLIASRCSGRNLIGSDCVTKSCGDKLALPSLTASMAFLAISTSTLNHSSARPLSSFPSETGLYPDFLSTWCTS